MRFPVRSLRLNGAVVPNCSGDSIAFRAHAPAPRGRLLRPATRRRGCVVRGKRPQLRVSTSMASLTDAARCNGVVFPSTSRAVTDKDRLPWDCCRSPSAQSAEDRARSCELLIALATGTVASVALMGGCRTDTEDAERGCMSLRFRLGSEASSVGLPASYCAGSGRTDVIPGVHHSTQRAHQIILGWRLSTASVTPIFG